MKFTYQSKTKYTSPKGTEWSILTVRMENGEERELFAKPELSGTLVPGATYDGNIAFPSGSEPGKKGQLYGCEMIAEPAAPTPAPEEPAKEAPAPKPAKKTAKSAAKAPAKKAAELVAEEVAETPAEEVAEEVAVDDDPTADLPDDDYPEYEEYEGEEGSGIASDDLPNMDDDDAVEESVEPEEPDEDESPATEPESVEPGDLPEFAEGQTVEVPQAAPETAKPKEFTPPEGFDLSTETTEPLVKNQPFGYFEEGWENEPNLKFFKEFRAVPEFQTAPRQGGRVTVISPCYILLVLTKLFGPVGTGWKYTLETEYTADRCVMRGVLEYKAEKIAGSFPFVGSAPLNFKGFTNANAEAMAWHSCLWFIAKQLLIGWDVFNTGFSPTNFD